MFLIIAMLAFSWEIHPAEPEETGPPRKIESPKEFKLSISEKGHGDQHAIRGFFTFGIFTYALNFMIEAGILIKKKKFIKEASLGVIGACVGPYNLV